MRREAVSEITFQENTQPFEVNNTIPFPKTKKNFHNTKPHTSLRTLEKRHF